MKKLRKEYSLEKNEYIEIKCGSINRIKPNVIYIECKTWLTPNFDGDLFNVLDEIMSRCKGVIKTKIISDDLFDNKFIFDYDIKSSSLRENKKSFMTLEVFIRQKDDILQKLEVLKSHIDNEYKNIVFQLVDDLNNHMFSLSRRK